jgi:hypothetical protein
VTVGLVTAEVEASQRIVNSLPPVQRTTAEGVE